MQRSYKIALCAAAVLWHVLLAVTWAFDQHHVEQSFAAFCKDWVATLNRYAQNNIACEQKDDQCIAEYRVCDDNLNIHVKPVPSAPACFIGTLRYREKKYRRAAQTCADAVRGPFALASETNVTQLFLYRNGVWQY
ncbi:MAG: hypothetical protein N3B18_04095 [Desulfobacterota bacterium]|nr:hypothetical protein [Thermodesulfobacteriota bacterium]